MLNSLKMFLIKNKIQCGLVFAAIIFTAQIISAQVPAPEDKIQISRAAAEKCLKDADRAEALEKELAVKNKAIEDLKLEVENLRRQLIEASTTASDLKQQAIRDAAIIELLLKYARPKKIGIINF